MTTESINAQSYFSDNVEVPVFEGTIIPNLTTKFDYWDLGEVNTENNRLDLVVGVSQKGNTGGSGNYIIGNWYKNEDNDNFNTEVINDRFINLTDYSNPITGLIFAKLSSSPSVKKEVVVSRLNGELEIYSNSGGSISFSLGFKANGKVAAVGNFTSGDDLEDVAVIMDDTVKIYKNLGNGYLDSIPVYRLANVHASAVAIAQINSYIEPYATVNGTTSNKDDIILRQGDSIRIYNNNNSNGTNLSTIIYTGSTNTVYNDFKVSDLNNDGYNDIVIVEEGYGINVYKNNSGSINTNPAYRNVEEVYFHTFTVGVGDFDKNGWNDIVVNLGSKMNLYLNHKGDSLYSQIETESFYYEHPVRLTCNPLKTVVADVYNKGGLAVMFTSFGDVQDLTVNDPLNEIEQLVRINASDTDAVPAPPLLFKDLVLIGQHYRPRLHIFNRGDRDFQKYIIYKKSPNFNNNNWFLYDSSNTSGDYIDDAEAFNEGGLSDPPPPDNLFYYVKAQDNSYQVSISSDTIGYPATVCPGCAWEAGDNFTFNDISSKELPIDYSVTNYPNPFNPVTQIYFNIPVEGNVRITVFNIAGQKVSELINEYKSAGSYKIDFNGNNLSSGIYYYRIESGSFSQVRKMILLK